MKGCRPPPIDPSTIHRYEHFDSKIGRFKSLYSPKKIVSMLNRCRSFRIVSAYVLKNYLTMKTKIAFLLNLERPTLLSRRLGNQAYFTVKIHNGGKNGAATVISVSS